VNVQHHSFPGEDPLAMPGGSQQVVGAMQLRRNRRGEDKDGRYSDTPVSLRSKRKFWDSCLAARSLYSFITSPIVGKGGSRKTIFPVAAMYVFTVRKARVTDSRNTTNSKLNTQCILDKAHLEKDIYQPVPLLSGFRLV